MDISVCIASYNGENHIVKQLNSILEQLDHNDEIIIVDDHSVDGTVNQIMSLNDPRIKIFINESNKGHVFSFDRAISLAMNDFVFTSDQDDIWIPGRVSLMIDELIRSKADLITSNFEWIDDDEKPIYILIDGVKVSNSSKFIKNIFDIYVGKTNYFGCCMAFRRSFVKLISPIPPFVESHDVWIALAANFIGSNCHLDANTLRKRKHSNNTTSTVSKRSLFQKIRARFFFTLGLITLLNRRMEYMNFKRNHSKVLPIKTLSM